MTKATTLIALATFNEIDNLPGLVDAILRVVPNADILVVDDNSPDGTGRWCDERAASEPRLRCTHRASKQGLGSATIEAMRVAIRDSYQVVVTMDADWSHDPSYIPALLAATAHVDVAIGSRYCPGGAIEGWPFHRRAASRFLNGLTHLALGLTVRDCSGSFRAYSVERLRDVDLDEVRSVGYAYLEEILWHLDRADARFAEVPITFRDRKAGRSKIGLRDALGKLLLLGRLRTQRQGADRRR
jgi:dolichol-phosphate mannosyltransferase